MGTKKTHPQTDALLKMLLTRKLNNAHFPKFIHGDQTQHRQSQETINTNGYLQTWTVTKLTLPGAPALRPEVPKAS